jgi:hypothetical protein
MIEHATAGIIILSKLLLSKNASLSISGQKHTIGLSVPLNYFTKCICIADRKLHIGKPHARCYLTVARNAKVLQYHRCTCTGTVNARKWQEQ